MVEKKELDIEVFTGRWIEQFRLLTDTQKSELFDVMVATNWTCVWDEFKQEYAQFQEKLERERTLQEQERLEEEKNQKSLLEEQEVEEKKEKERQKEQKRLEIESQKAAALVLEQEKKKRKQRNLVFALIIIFSMLWVYGYVDYKKQQEIDKKQQEISFIKDMQYWWGENEWEKNYVKLYDLLIKRWDLKWTENGLVEINWKYMYINNWNIKYMFSSLKNLEKSPWFKIWTMRFSEYVFDKNFNKIWWPYGSIVEIWENIVWVSKKNLNGKYKDYIINLNSIDNSCSIWYDEICHLGWKGFVVKYKWEYHVTDEYWYILRKYDPKVDRSSLIAWAL